MSRNRRARKNKAAADWQAEQITFEHAPQRPAIRSVRAATVARFFGIEDQLPSAATTDVSTTPAPADRYGGSRGTLRDLLPRAGQIVLLTGASGAGKSTLLRALRESAARHRIRWIDLDAAALPDVPVVDCFGAAFSVERAMELLSRVGLAEAWTYLRTPAELSDGQHWRLRLAMCLAGFGPSSCRCRGRTILACDEFAALLDRITACIVARSLRKTIDALPGSRIGVAVATSHEDLVRALAPDVVVECDFARINVMRLHRMEAS
jgi:ABC-type ATPase with predicted acetyltransferase domain